MSRVSARSRTAGFALFAIALAVGVAGANASRSIVAYNVYPLISDGTAVSAPLAVRAQKRLMRRWERLSLDEAVQAGIDALAQAASDGEHIERMSAFIKRKTT